MADHDDMIVRLQSIGPGGLAIDRAVSKSWLAKALGEDAQYQPAGDGRLELHLQRVDDVVHLRGRANIELTGICSRCLGPASLGMSVPLEVAMFPGGKEPPAGPDGELKHDDMGVASYRQQQIDLGSVVHDQVFLELPMNPVCADSCKGLCPGCGSNLNEKSCECQSATASWSTFRELKLN